MQMTNHTEALADMLGGRDVFRSILANSPRSDRDYNIFVGVPAHCLTAENSKVNFEQEFPYQVIDLLICRGEEAVLAIVFDAEYRDMERLFSACLQAVPHEFLKSEELTEDAAEELCGQIESRLRCDRDDPLHTGIMLHSVRLRHAIFRAKKAKSEVRRIMEEGTCSALEAKHLIGSDGSVTGYGHACGMFCCQLTGSVGRAYVFAPHAVEKLKRAIAWHDSAGTDVTLENRLARLNQGLPSGSSQQQAAKLKNLLQTPLEDFLPELSRGRAPSECSAESRAVFVPRIQHQCIWRQGRNRNLRRCDLCGEKPLGIHGPP